MSIAALVAASISWVAVAANSPNGDGGVTAAAAATDHAVTTKRLAAANSGSLDVGQSAYPVPAAALYVSATSGSDANAGTVQAPLKTIVAAVRQAAPGSAIVLRAGEYHESILVPATKSNLTIQAYPREAVWLDGSVPVTNWVKSGRTWTSNGWTARFDTTPSFVEGSSAGNFINPSYPMAAHPDQLFIDGIQLRQVAGAAQVTPGTFAVDYAAQTLTLGSDPAGQQVRATTLPSAVVVAAAGVSLRGFGVRRYGDPLPQGGAIYLAKADDQIQNLVIDDIAGEAVGVYKSNATIDHVSVRGAGMMGIGETLADGSVIENSSVTQSNTEHFNSAPAAAAIKIVRSRHITVRDNNLSSNYDAAGAWLDESVVDFLVIGNTVGDNGNVANIQTELSDTGIVANNTVTGGDRGLFIFDTGNVKVYNNEFAQNSRGSVFISQDARRETTPGPNHDPRQPIPDPTDPWVVRNITISNNIFAFNGGKYGFQIYALDNATHISAAAMNLTITGNLFHTSNSKTDTMVGWGGNDDVTVQRLQSTSALDSAAKKSWLNAQISAGSLSDSYSYAAQASMIGVRLPADVAAAMGVQAGVQTIGTVS